MTKYPLTRVTTAGVSSAFPARRKAFRGKHPEGEYPTLRRRRRGALAVYGTPDITTVLRFQFPAAPAGQTLTGANLRLRTMTLASGTMSSCGVDVVISGHNHASEVFKPIGASGTGAAPVLSDTGIRAFTAGGGGADIQALTPNSDPLLSAMVARSNAAFGPLRLTLKENSYSWQFLPVPGMTCANAGTSGTFSGSDNCH